MLLKTVQGKGRESGCDGQVQSKKYHVTLTPEERGELERLVSAGKAAARKLAHARILLKAGEAEGGATRGPTRRWTQVSTVARVRQRFVGQGLEAALARKPANRTYARRPGGTGEARLVAPACSQPPQGRKKWTLQLLAGRMVVPGQAPRLGLVHQGTGGWGV